MTTLQEVMTEDMVHVEPGDKLETIAKEMDANDIGFVPVMEEDRLLGVVTDRDVVRRGLAKDFKANEVSAAEVMTEKVITGYPDMQVEEASRLMQDHQIKRLIVEEDGNVKGALSLGDLAVNKYTDQTAGNTLSEVKK